MYWFEKYLEKIFRVLMTAAIAAVFAMVFNILNDSRLFCAFASACVSLAVAATNEFNALAIDEDVEWCNIVADVAGTLLGATIGTVPFLL